MGSARCGYGADVTVQGYQAAACPHCGRRSMILSFAGVGEGTDLLHPAHWRYQSAECMEGCTVPAGWIAAGRAESA